METVIGWAFPKCQQCGVGDLVPLSDHDGDGASLRYKAWVCTNPGCVGNIKIRLGELCWNEPMVMVDQQAVPAKVRRARGIRAHGAPSVRGDRVVQP